MYYIGTNVNAHLPLARDPNQNRVVPLKKPPLGTYPGEKFDTPLALSKFVIRGQKRALDTNNGVEFKGAIHPPTSVTPDQKRCFVLKEVREHLELLKEFEGIISIKELNQRKKDLFNSLPPAPGMFLAEKNTGISILDKSDKLCEKVLTESTIMLESTAADCAQE